MAQLTLMMNRLKGFTHLILSLALVCGLITSVQAAPVQERTIKNIEILPLPGALDDIPMFNSNCPEVVEEEGILLSSLPTPDPKDNSIFLDYPFKGHFNVYLHHIARDKKLGERKLYLGLLAHNRTDNPITIRQWQGASYLSQPDAIFKKLPELADNDKGKIYAGPGDRVTTELLFSHTYLKNKIFVIPPHSTQLLYSVPIPTDVAIPPPINGRNMQLRMESDGPIYLSNVAAFAPYDTFLGFKMFKEPTLANFQAFIDMKHLAGPREDNASDTPEPRPKGGHFHYGRVAGVSQGSRWVNFPIVDDPTLWKKLETPGNAIAFPISSVYLKRFGLEQNQSGIMFKKMPGTAPQSHSNYGVTYVITVPLKNTTQKKQRYTFALTHPLGLETQPNHVVYASPPNELVTFRGTVRMDWTDENEKEHSRFFHITLRDGQDIPPFMTLKVPPDTTYNVKFNLIYPADATPPQLLTISHLK